MLKNVAESQGENNNETSYGNNLKARFEIERSEIARSHTRTKSSAEDTAPFDIRPKFGDLDTEEEERS
jgi:hypothetical protein